MKFLRVSDQIFQQTWPNLHRLPLPNEQRWREYSMKFWIGQKIQISAKNNLIKIYLWMMTVSLCGLVSCGPHGGAPKVVGADAGAMKSSSLVMQDEHSQTDHVEGITPLVLVKPQIGQWNSLSFTFDLAKALPEDGMISLGQPLKKDHGRQKILRWMAAALASSSPLLRKDDQWAEEDDLISLTFFESRWAKEFNDEYQRVAELRPRPDFKMHTVFTFALFKAISFGPGPVMRDGHNQLNKNENQNENENENSNKKANKNEKEKKKENINENINTNIKISENNNSLRELGPAALAEQRRWPISLNRLFTVSLNLVAYRPENGTLRFLQSLPKFIIHHGALQVTASCALDPALIQTVMQNRELLGLQLADYNLAENISYREWKTEQKKKKALVVISTPQETRPYYISPVISLGEVLKIYDRQMEIDQERVLKFGGSLIAATNTSSPELNDLAADNYGPQDFIFYTSHALNTKLLAGQTYYVGVATFPEIQNAVRTWSPWQEHEVRFPLGDRGATDRLALHFDRPLEKGDLLEIELLRENEFIDDVHKEHFFKNRYAVGPASTSNYINILEALDAMALSWEIGDRRFALSDCHQPGSRIYYYDFWQSLPGPLSSLHEESSSTLSKLHHAQTFIDWEMAQNTNLPISLFWHHSALLEQSLSKWIKAVKIKVRGRVWRKQL